MTESHKISDVVVRIPTETYGFIECKVEGVETLQDAYKLRNALRVRELEDRKQRSETI